MFYVYVHTVPNGKIYIGETKDPQTRWNNGEGYRENELFYKDIQIYGWNNIKHEIIDCCEDVNTALKLEAVLIALTHSEHEDYGYNQTSIYNEAMKKYTSRSEISGIMLEESPSDSILENSNLPRSACEELIDQWVFNEEHRSVLKDRLLNGLNYSKLAELYSKSERQLKRIVHEGSKRLEKHLI